MRAEQNAPNLEFLGFSNFKNVQEWGVLNHGALDEVGGVDMIFWVGSKWESNREKLHRDNRYQYGYY